jgi:hypothetical protein
MVQEALSTLSYMGKLVSQLPLRPRTKMHRLGGTKKWRQFLKKVRMLLGGRTQVYTTPTHQAGLTKKTLHGLASCRILVILMLGSICLSRRNLFINGVEDRMFNSEELLGLVKDLANNTDDWLDDWTKEDVEQLHRLATQLAETTHKVMVRNMSPDAIFAVYLATRDC